MSSGPASEISFDKTRQPEARPAGGCYECADRVTGTAGKPTETRNLRILVSAPGAALGPIIISTMLGRSRGWAISTRGFSALTIGKRGFLRKFLTRIRVSF